MHLSLFALCFLLLILWGNISRISVGFILCPFSAQHLPFSFLSRPVRSFHNWITTLLQVHTFRKTSPFNSSTIFQRAILSSSFFVLTKSLNDCQFFRKIVLNELLSIIFSFIAINFYNSILNFCSFLPFCV